MKVILQKKADVTEQNKVQIRSNIFTVYLLIIFNELIQHMYFIQ